MKEFICAALVTAAILAMGFAMGMLYQQVQDVSKAVHELAQTVGTE